MSASLRTAGVVEERGLRAVLHQGKHVAQAREHLLRLLRVVIEQCVKQGLFRSDVPSAELATYCLHALAAAASLRSSKAVRRLIDVILGGLR